MVSAYEERYRKRAYWQGAAHIFIVGIVMSTIWGSIALAVLGPDWAAWLGLGEGLVCIPLVVWAFRRSSKAVGTPSFRSRR